MAQLDLKDHLPSTFRELTRLIRDTEDYERIIKWLDKDAITVRCAECGRIHILGCSCAHGK